MSDGAMLRPEEVREDYNKTVKDAGGEYIRYRWLSSPTQRRHYAQTGASLRWVCGSMTRPGRLLEVGCGPAVWTPLFLPIATTATLLDISEEMLNGAKAALSDQPDVGYVRADFTEAQLEPASFDIAVSIRSFEYWPDKPASLRKFHSALAPGGRLIIVTKNAGWRDHDRAQREESRKTEMARNVRLQSGVIDWRELEALAAQAGFRDIRIHPVVVGSYLGLSRTWPALQLFDLIHAATYKAPMRGGLSPWVESVLLLATR